jgi:predicted RND superfamily exporter protein
MVDWYFRALQYPRLVLVLFLALSLIAVSGSTNFRFDASSDTLVVQGDPKLLEYNRMSMLFDGDDFVVLTYHHDNLFSDSALTDLAELQASMSLVPGIQSTYSILDAPFIASPSIPLDRIADSYLTLRNPNVDRGLARLELTTSPLFANYLISEDGKTTAISGTLRPDRKLQALTLQRDELKDLSTAKAVAIETAYVTQREVYKEQRKTMIDALRLVKEAHPRHEQIFISGVPMIAADMLAYVKSDLQMFGAIILLLIVALLYLFFRKLRWVILPLTICVTSVAITIGLLGAFETPVTVVSSNFISLLSIISISFSIHLIVRYRELLAKGEMPHQDIITETMRSKFAPCLYTALTTLLAFGSMLASGIMPIVDFGWMMCVGILIALIVTYILFPSILILMGGAKASKTLGSQLKLTTWLQNLSVQHSARILIASVLIFGVSLYGVSKLTFDNRFVDYFHEKTDIRQGMEQIDKSLGGTLPLDIYVRFEPFEVYEDDFAAPGDSEFPERYWFTPEKIEMLNAIQQRLERQPEIGKVLSLSSVERIARNYNEGEALTGFQLSYLLAELPKDIRRVLIDPYSDPASGWMRINARIAESQHVFSKTQLVNDIKSFLLNDIGLENDEVVITGMVVLFDDMLKQLADSQIRTLGYVVAATLLMFALLLRSLKLALIALIPNLLAAILILAFMGYANISMDMMTVTIAAICIGIGVDDAIHYLHRFKLELVSADTVSDAVIASHQTIGRAMYFTTMTVMGGFSILAFSNFVPTVYFGLLTSMAMGLALLANLLLLPSLLVALNGGRAKH